MRRCSPHGPKWPEFLVMCLRKGDFMVATSIATRTMKAAQIAGPGAEFELVEREIPEPGPGQVRIKVQACGICHSDALTKDGHLPGIDYPRIPGHEVVGKIDAFGDAVF